ncbi:MAG: SMI1/KNR4 family protein [Clostridiales bacterium]|nr:SMI1/KNR4 family protein [Clostridiales bacterium]
MNFENFCVLVEHYKKSKPHLFELEADCTVDDRQISIIENEYGIVLPDSYKNLIKNFGGGYFGFIAFYSFDQNSPFDFSKNVSVKLIKELLYFTSLKFIFEELHWKASDTSVFIFHHRFQNTMVFPFLLVLQNLFR